MRSNWLLFLGLVGITACAPGEREAVALKSDPIPYTLDPRGIQLVGQRQRIDFGRTDHSAERAMNKLVGHPPVSRGVCPDGRPFVDWPDGTRFYFSGGALEGWSKTTSDGSIQRGGSICS